LEIKISNDENEQKAIASVLSSLDDKIDLLHRQNKTLEAMAETLFRQWFVEEAQEDWEKIVITEFFEIRDGTHDSPKQSHAGKPLITSKHIGTNRLDIENAYLISETDFHNVNKRSKVETNDILFSMIGTIGLTYLEQSETVDYAIKNIGLFKTSQNPVWRYYTFLWINSSLGKEFIHEYRSGSTQEYIALGSLRSIVFDAPPLNLLLEFNKVIHAYFQKIKNNMLQIRTLEKLRDTLLPELVNGKVRVEYDAN
jgi:type I restriction enzyme, S subunit